MNELALTNSSANPTAMVKLDFADYLAQRQSELAAHTRGGVPDYAFSLDEQLRQKLAAMPPIRAIAQGLVSMWVPLHKQLQQMSGVAVSPQQYPEIYAIGEDCARRLGIGIPEIFIDGSRLINAYTIATDDVMPIIVLTAKLVEVCTPQELKFIIGHECGHIHNLHGVYNTTVELMVNPAMQMMFRGMFMAGLTINVLNMVTGIMQGSLRLFLSQWSRSAELTCDRAGLICCGDLHSAQSALAKLIIGQSGQLEGFNVQAYLAQISKVQASPLRLMELSHSHPLIPKRIEALRLFADCDVLHAWRPELRTTNPVRSKAETDQACEQFMNVLKTGYQSQT